MAIGELRQGEGGHLKMEAGGGWPSEDGGRKRVAI